MQSVQNYESKVIERTAKTATAGNENVVNKNRFKKIPNICAEIYYAFGFRELKPKSRSKVQ